MHFIFDCDDVLLNWQDGFLKHMTDRGYGPAPTGPTDWNLAGWIGCTDKEARSFVRDFNGSRAFGELGALDGAVELLWALKDAGHTISVLTCCGTQRTVRYERIMNLMYRFGRLKDGDVIEPYDEITVLDLGESKFETLYNFSQTRGDVVFVEDNFAHAQSGTMCGFTSYCLRRNHNRQLEAQHPDTAVIWIDDFAPLLERYIS